MKTCKLLALILLAQIIIQSCKKEESQSLQDQQFIDRTVSSNTFKIAAGNLAVSKGNSEEVKAFGELLVKEHTSASKELANLVESKGWVLPAYMYVKDQVRLDLLHKVNAAEFDQEFAKIMTQSHEEAIDLFKEASVTHSVKDNDLRNFAGNKIPVLTMHLEIAMDLRKMNSTMTNHAE